MAADKPATTATTTETVWRAFREELLAFIRRRVRQEADAEDILQKVFLSLHRHLLTEPPPEHLRGWLYRITRNAITDAARSRRTTDHVVEDAVIEGVPQDGEPDTEAAEHLAGCLAGMVQTLSENYRQALLWTEFQGATQEVAAARAGISLSGMKSRVQRGRQRLREALLACCEVELDRTNKPIDYRCRSATDCGDCS